MKEVKVFSVRGEFIGHFLCEDIPQGHPRYAPAVMSAVHPYYWHFANELGKPPEFLIDMKSEDGDRHTDKRFREYVKTAKSVK